MRGLLLAGFILTGFLAGMLPARAQSDTSQVQTKFVCTVEGIQISDLVINRPWTIKVSPQHFFVNALNLEIERQLAPESNNSLTFSPRFYSGNTQTIDKFAARENNEEIARVKGYGAEIMYRFYKPNPVNPKGQQYFAYGFNYHHFDLDYAVLGWNTERGENGMEYIQYGWQPRQETVTRTGVVAMFGLQNPFLTDRLITDCFGGIGYRFSQSSEPDSNHFKKNIMDFGSAGVYLTVGFKLGYAF